jgi:hypothetical protein
MADESPYQQNSTVEQLRGELENALAYGQETRAAAARKQLAELGVDEDDDDGKAKAAEKRKAADKSEPEGRATRQEKQSTTEAAAKSKT